jgi:hypothetical protein
LKERRDEEVRGRRKEMGQPQKEKSIIKSRERETFSIIFCPLKKHTTKEGHF